MRSPPVHGLGHPWLGLLATPLVTQAQPSGRVPRIGILGFAGRGFTVAILRLSKASRRGA